MHTLAPDRRSTNVTSRSVPAWCPFAGWEMPVQYEGVIERAPRGPRAAPASSTSRTWASSTSKGPRRTRCLQSLLSNDLDRIGDGDAQYTLLTNERGGIVDDLIAYRRRAPFHYLLVVNAGNRDAAFAWLKEREIRGSEVRDASDEYALLAVQGPAVDRAARPRRRTGVHARDGRDRRRRDDGLPHRLHRASAASSCCARPRTPGALWDAVVARGAVPCGLGARDTLRLEVCYPLHGNDITQETDAISAGLGWTCALDKEFTGAEVLRAREGDAAAEHGSSRS